VSEDGRKDGTLSEHGNTAKLLKKCQRSLQSEDERIIKFGTILIQANI
jgi:hypothetical protein